MKLPSGLAVSFLALGLASAVADVVVNPLFADHMVLQRERPQPSEGELRRAKP